MTKEPIMIDDVDVSKCECIIEDYQRANNLEGRYDHIKNVCELGERGAEYYNLFCKDNPNCNYKNWKRKEQECEELKQRLHQCWNVENSFVEQLDQLEAENKEYKNIINKLAGKTIAITSGDKPFEFCDHKDLTIKQLKLDKETYKYQWEKQYELCEYWQGQAEKHKQALKEIKEIAELKQKQSVFVGETVFEQILQKCEEVLDV